VGVQRTGVHDCSALGDATFFAGWGQVVRSREYGMGRTMGGDLASSFDEFGVCCRGRPL